MTVEDATDEGTTEGVEDGMTTEDDGTADPAALDTVVLTTLVTHQVVASTSPLNRF